MKATIAYATHAGTTAKAAQLLADALTKRGFTTELVNLADTTPDLSADVFVLGGGIRMGQWPKAARDFAAKHRGALLQKPLALFVCRCGDDNTRALLEAQTDAELAAHAAFADSFGGELDITKLKGFARMIVRMVAKSDKSGDMKIRELLTERIDACADALQKAVNA